VKRQPQNTWQQNSYYIDVDVHKVDKYGDSAVKPKRQGSTQTHRRSVPVNKIELLYTQLKRSPRLKMQHRWRHERRFQKKMQARLFLSTHTPPLKIDENVSSALPPQHKLLGPAVQHGVNSYSDQNLEALPAPFTFLGLQVNSFWGNQ